MTPFLQIMQQSYSTENVVSCLYLLANNLRYDDRNFGGRNFTNATVVKLTLYLASVHQHNVIADTQTKYGTTVSE